MKTQGEIEAAICEKNVNFEKNYMGRGPSNIHTYVLDDLIVVRLLGIMTEAEKRLAKSLPSEKGRDLIKQVRTHLIEVARPELEAIIEEITGIKVLSLHQDISTHYGEEIIIFTLKQPIIIRSKNE